MFYVLQYDYVPDIVERRGPFRAEHLSLAGELLASGVLRMAGAWADPVDGAQFIFQTDDRSLIEAFVERDPYVLNGLVTAWRIREWNVVVGGEQGSGS